MLAVPCALRVGVLCALLCALLCVPVDGDLDPVRPESAVLKPRVMIAVLARNSAHSLPHFLGCIDRLEYPKERMAIW
ncbi:procollagen galactosyltransferase 2 [Tachysurus ichikawai]